MHVQSVLARKYIRVPVAAREAGSNVNVSADTVTMAFPVQDVQPVTGDWTTASWETDATTTPTTYYARCLVGPSGTIALPVGVYDCWVSVLDAPELEIEKAGNVQIM